MLDVYEKYDKYKVKGKKLGIVNRNTFNHEEMKKKLLNIVDKLVDDIKVQDKLFHKNMPKKVELKLPTLKKEPKKLNLPKLKKGNMAEVKITCPNCMNDKHCFEET